MRHLIVAASVLLVHGIAQAQSVATCRDPHPAPVCGGYFIFEYNGALRIAGNWVDLEGSRTKALPSWAGVDVGRMWNRSPSTSLGGALEIGPSGDGNRIALRAKRREWLAKDMVLDLSGGPLIAQLETTGTPDGIIYTYGATGDIGFGRARVGLITIGSDVARQRGQFAFGTHMGARLESRGSVVATAVAFVGSLIAVGVLVTHRGVDSY